MTRKKAIEMLKALNMMLRSPDGEPISDVCDALDMAIEALTDRPTGEWTNTAPPNRSDNIVCNQCGYNSIARYDYCPNCGAKMCKGGDDDAVSGGN